MINMMDVEILSSKENVLEIMVKNESHTLLNLLVDELNKDSNVEYATYVLVHPLENKIKMIVMTNGNVTPLSAIKRAINSIDKKIDKLRKELQTL